MSSKVNQLWQLPPVLAAFAIPSWYIFIFKHFFMAMFCLTKLLFLEPCEGLDWEGFPLLNGKIYSCNCRSKLFRSYLRELEGQLIGNSLATRSVAITVFLDCRWFLPVNWFILDRHCSCLAGTLEHRECGFA